MGFLWTVTPLGLKEKSLWLQHLLSKEVCLAGSLGLVNHGEHMETK
jgi:hypothetical protein